MKVVSAKEMSRIEKIAFERGASDILFMEEAGKNVACAFERIYAESSSIVVLAGKGNNAGDAYVAARTLLNNHSIKVYQLVPLDECSKLCQLQAKKFQEAGGIIHTIASGEEIQFAASDIILDGILGTGFQGAVEGLFFDAISLANRSKCPIVAIDIPSGLNGNTGVVGSIAIEATWTFFLELPKSGFFIQQGLDHIGRLEPISFSLDSSLIELAKADFIMEADSTVACLLPKIKRTRHKYQRGSVVGFTGSFGMPGAAFLSGLAALRAGAGIVKLACPKEMQSEIAFAPPELIRIFYDETHLEDALLAAKDTSAIYIGPGIGKTPQAQSLVKKVLSGYDRPLVIDADCLNIISEDSTLPIPKGSILTPHKGEMDRLLHGKYPSSIDFNYLSLCQAFCDEKNVTIVLKGAPTFILSAHTIPFVSIKGDPGMATAGSGDVLTGIIAAFLAAGLKPTQAALLGVYFHGISGEIAALETTSFAMIAEDLIHSFPKTFKYLQQLPIPMP